MMKLELRRVTWLIPVIGEKSCTAKQSITDGEKEDEVIETDMNDSELENFKNEWEEKWSQAHILELLDATTKKKPNNTM